MTLEIGEQIAQAIWCDYLIGYLAIDELPWDGSLEFDEPTPKRMLPNARVVLRYKPWRI